MTEATEQPLRDTDVLRGSTRDEYATVATVPEHGIHSHSCWHEARQPPTGGRMPLATAARPAPAAGGDLASDGRIAVSAERHGPVLVRHDGAVVALDPGGSMLNASDGRTQPVRGWVARLSPGEGPYWLTDDRGLVVALTR